MDWKTVKKEKPNCWETGDWDGKKSDEVLCVDEKGEKHLARCYEGYMDGSYFFEWYDKDDFGLQVEVTYWIELDDVVAENTNNQRSQLIAFMKHYKNNVPIGTQKSSKQLVSEYLTIKKYNYEKHNYFIDAIN